MAFFYLLYSIVATVSSRCVDSSTILWLFVRQWFAFLSNEVSTCPKASEQRVVYITESAPF